MAWFSWFKRRRENDDFETILNELEEAIRQREEKLAFIKHRESRGVVLITTYSSIAWLAYIALWYFGILDYATNALNGSAGHDEQEQGILEQAVKTLPIGAVPIVIFFTRRIVRAWYQRKQASENKELTSLRKRQKDQIDKLKKLSNYDKITQMLERHGQIVQVPIKQGGMSTPGGKSRPGSAFSTPTAKNGQQMQLTPAQQAIMAAQKNTVLSQQQSGKAGALPGTPQRSVPPQGLNMQVYPQGMASPGPPQPKNFFDRLADAAANALLGDNEASPASKYALICQRCYAHNGLVLKEEVMDIRFTCPRCGFFNPSRRERMTGSTDAAASAPAQPSSLRTSSTAIEREAGNDSIDSLPSPTLAAAKLGGASSPPTTDTDSTSPLLSGRSDSEDKLTSKMKEKEGRENLKRRAKGRNNSTDMDIDDD